MWTLLDAITARFCALLMCVHLMILAWLTLLCISPTKDLAQLMKNKWRCSLWHRVRSEPVYACCHVELGPASVSAAKSRHAAAQGRGHGRHGRHGRWTALDAQIQQLSDHSRGLCSVCNPSPSQPPFLARPAGGQRSRPWGLLRVRSALGGSHSTKACPPPPPPPCVLGAEVSESCQTLHHGGARRNPVLGVDRTAPTHAAHKAPALPPPSQMVPEALIPLPSSSLPPFSPSHVRLLVASHLDSAYQMTRRAGCRRHCLHTESLQTSSWPAAMLLAAASPGEWLT